MKSRTFHPLPLVAALWAVFSVPAYAQFTVSTGITDTVAKTLTGAIGTVESGATLTTNDATATITVITGTSSINNAGTISQTDTARTIDANAGTPVLTLTNQVGGLITATGNVVIRLNRQAGSYLIDNQGTISQIGPSVDGERAIKADAAYTSTNNRIINGSESNTAAVISSTGNDALRLGTNFTLTNYGRILSTGVVNTSCPGYMSVQCAAGDDFSAADGVAIENARANVVIINHGRIEGPRHGIDGGDPVAATASANLLGADRLTITATGPNGVTFDRESGGTTTSDVAIANPVIINHAGGIVIGRNGSGVGLDGHGVVFNWGLISGNYAGAGNIYDHESLGLTTSNGDGDGVDIDGVAYIENHGRIEGTGAGGLDSGGNPNGADGIAAGGGTIINHVGAAIYGQSKGILIDDGANGIAIAAQRGTSTATGAAARIVNDGTITGDKATAIGLVGDFADVVINGATGVITGGTQSLKVDEANSTTPGAAVQMGSGNDTLTNQGRIEGKNGLAIDMGDGDDVLKLFNGGSTGVVVGTMAGGAGADTLETGGTQRFETGTLSGFESFVVRDGSTTFTYGLGTVTSVQVDAGARLQVNGSLGTSGDLLVNGQLAAPEGQTLRTVNVGGNYSQGASGVLEARLGAGNQSDLVSTTGSATLTDGATIRALPRAYVNDGAQFTLVSGGGGLSANAANLQLVNESVLVQYTLSTTGNLLVLGAQRKASLAQLAPEGLGGLAGALEALGRSGDSSLSPLLGVLDAQTSSQGVASTLRELSPNSASTAFQVAQTTGSAFFSAMGARLDQARAVDNALAGTTGLSAGDSAGRRLWAQGLGTWGEQKARAGNNGYELGAHGIAGGFETDRSARQVMGLSLAYTQADSDGTGTGIGDDVRVKATSVGGYMSHELEGGTTLDTSVVLGHNRYHSQRLVNVAGAVQQLQGRYNGWQLGAQLEAGFPFAAAEFNGRWLAGARVGYLSTDRYTETGGSAALSMASGHASSLQSMLGVELARALSSTSTVLLRARYLHEFANVRPTNATLVAGGPSFASTSAQPGRDMLQLGLGWRHRPSAGITLSVNYDAELKSGYLAHQLSARAMWAF